MSFWHSLIPESLYNDIQMKNCNFSLVTFDTPSPIPEECMEDLGKVETIMANVSMYNIFGKCWNGTENGVQLSDQNVKRGFTEMDYTPWAFSHRNDNLKLLPPCVWGAPLTDYLTRDDVRKALYIPDTV